MVKKMFSVLVVLFVLYSCSNRQSAVYSKGHWTGFYKNIDSGKNTPESYLNWGDKLKFLNSNITNQISTDKQQIFAKVKNDITGNEGYVDIDNLIFNPVARGVILSSTLIYGTPSLTASSKMSINPPILVFIKEIKNNEWALITPYNAGAVYNLPDAVLTPIYGDDKWISVKDVSTNQANVDIIAALQMSIYNYNSAKNAYDGKGDAAQAKFQKIANTEADSIGKILEKYPQADSAVFTAANAFIGMVRPAEGTTGSDSLDNNGGTENSDSNSDQL